MRGAEEPHLFDLPAPTSSTPKVSEEDVQEVFEFWRETMCKNVKTTRLTKPRRKNLARALEWYPKEFLMQAIVGCKLSPWHMGQNPQGKVYNDLEMIVRTEQRIEHLAQIAQERAERDAAIAKLADKEWG